MTSVGLGGERLVPAFPALRFENPVFLTHAPDGQNRLFVVEQKGRVLWFNNQPDVKEATVAIDLRAQVRSNGSEEGLLGLAFHPQFKSNRQVFLHYSASGPRRNVVSRFRMNDKGQIVPSSEEVLLEIEQPYSNHNGGMMAFGPDGYLYIALGDGGSAGDPRGHAQNRETLLGSMVRIDVDKKDPGLPYAIPTDNPFFPESGVRREIWAYGLRNPWRFSFDRQTGTLWAGDVGQVKREEINIITKGGNYGWNFREGKTAYKNKPLQGGVLFIDPVIDHPRDAARSITGGYVYRGKENPSLVGWYVYGDFVTGNIWKLKKNPDGSVQNERFERTGLISSFGEDEAGEIYVVSYKGTLYTFE